MLVGMAKTRLSISLDPEDAERIRDAARRTGLDVSRYIVRAAIEAVHRDEWNQRHHNEVFADIDAEIAEAERLADEMPLPPLVGELSPAERAAIKAQWDAFFGGSQHGAA
jgi:predicted transcriptional regulator